MRHLRQTAVLSLALFLGACAGAAQKGGTTAQTVDLSGKTHASGRPAEQVVRVAMQPPATRREDIPACLAHASFTSFRLDTQVKAKEANDVPQWARGMVPKEDLRGHGSGWVVSTDGYIVTNAHVVRHEGQTGIVTITMDVDRISTPVTVTAKVLAVDEKLDLALVKVDRQFSRAVVIADASEVVKGMGIYNVGYPYDFGEMVGRGHIMRLHHRDTGREMSFNDTILADISDGPGTSGSGVYSETTGKLVGTMMAYAYRSDGYEKPKWVVRVVIPVERIRRFLDEHLPVKYQTSAPGVPVCGSP